MNPTFDDTDLFLLAILPATRDLEIARMLGWYRIPLRSAPKVIETDYIAFYQTGAFGEGHRWMVESAAQVRGHELTTRGQLFKDEPDHPRKNEEYYKLSIGPIFHLPHKIQAGSWKRVTFLYTTGGRIRKAETLRELITHNTERDLLLHALRDRAAISNLFRVKPQAEMELDPAIMVLLAGLEQGGGL